MTVPLLWFLCIFVWADLNAADSSQPKRYLTMLRMGKRTERSALTDVEGSEELNDEQYIILYPGRNTPGASGDRTRQAFFKVPRVGRRSTAQHSDLNEKEIAKRKAAGYGFDVNLPLLYDEYQE